MGDKYFNATKSLINPDIHAYFSELPSRYIFEKRRYLILIPENSFQTNQILSRAKIVRFLSSAPGILILGSTFKKRKREVVREQTEQRLLLSRTEF